MTSANAILSYLINDCDLSVFPVHSITSSGDCTCQGGAKCNSPGKHPYLNVGWKKLATNNLDRLNKLTKGRAVNYAVATGRKSSKTQKYLVVVDVDQKEHEILAMFPKTFSYKTGSGGYHYWFWSPTEVKNSVSKVAKKVDIRGTGGYVIIPPSRHKSGNNYELLCEPTQAILDLTPELLALVEQKDEKFVAPRKTVKKKAVQTTVDKTVSDWWTKSPIVDLRSVIQNGTLIPIGVRNVVIHRLLSSDRAKGVASYEDLMTLATGYKAVLEDEPSFDARELHNTIISVMRYPVYNTQAENVTKNYVKWLKKNKGVSADLAVLEKVDSRFFQDLTPGKGYVSLAQVCELRKQWYASKQITDFAVYKPQLLAKKLRSLGFSRTRTAKSNLWNVNVQNLLADDTSSCDDVLNRRMKMTTEATTTETETTPDTTPETGEVDTSGEVSTLEEGKQGNGPIGPDGLPMTLIEEREEIIETDRKYHPDDAKYIGQRSNQELMMAQIKFYEQISEEQAKEYENGNLLFDEERTRDWMSVLLPGDIIGIKTFMHKVQSVSDDEISVTTREWNKYERKYTFDGEESTIGIFDIDNALSIGFGQILYRGDRPFGLDKEMAYKVKVKVYADSVGRTYVFKSGREVTALGKNKESADDGTETSKPTP